MMDPLIGILIRDGRQVPYIMESDDSRGSGYAPREFANVEEAEAYVAQARAHAARMREAAAAFDAQFLEGR